MRLTTSLMTALLAFVLPLAACGAKDTDNETGPATTDDPETEVAAVKLDTVTISEDRRTLTVEAGASPQWACYAADAGASAHLQDNVLVVSVLRRFLVAGPQPTCPPICEAPLVNTITLEEPLPQGINTARAADDAVDTCRSIGHPVVSHPINTN